MSGWKRAPTQGPGRGCSSLRPGPRSAVILVSAALVSIGIPAARAAGAGCGALGPARKTVEGLPRDSGEASGLVSSPRYPGAAWMVRDSGHPANLYALRFNPDGTATSREIPVPGATNRDWEEITWTPGPDGSGRLWIVESGQGGGGRVIYELAEPDPDSATSVRPLARYSYAYPDGSANTEAAFTWDGDIVLVTKNFPARVYRFTDGLRPGITNKPDFVGELSDSNGVSVAKPSPDGRWLATATHDTVSMYRNSSAPGTLEGFLDREPTHLMVAAPDDNVEAGDFYPTGGCSLVLLAETRNTYRLDPQ